MRDFYEGLHFYNEDGTLNMIASPEYTTKVLCKNGLKRYNETQVLDKITVYNADVFCPKNFSTGIINITGNTFSIHHFTASWLDEEDRNFIEHKRMIYSRSGEYLGRYILIIEEIFRTYGVKSIIVIFIKLIKRIIKLIKNKIR